MSLFEVGAAAGALSAYFLGDRLGRKWTTFAAAVTALVGIILQTTSFQVPQLIVGRIIGGKLTRGFIPRHIDKPNASVFVDTY